MQILPDTFLDRAEDALGAARLPVPGDEGFARALNQSVQDIRNNQADVFRLQNRHAAISFLHDFKHISTVRLR